METVPVPPSAAVPSGTLDLSTGVHVRYTDRGDLEGETLLFLHGYTDSSFSFSRVLPLVPPVYRSVTFDQRGHGDSERPADGYAMGDFAADAAAVLDALGIERATVVGHSMGSLVAQRLALDHPRLVARLVLVGSAAKGRNENVLALRADVVPLSDPVPRAFARKFQLSAMHAPVPETFVDEVVAASCKLPAHLWRSVLDNILAFDTAAELPRLRCPTLIVWGDQDSLFGREDQDSLLAAIPDARLVTYPETGHCPNWERPDWFARDLLAFATAAHRAGPLPARESGPTAERLSPPRRTPGVR